MPSTHTKPSRIQNQTPSNISMIYHLVLAAGCSLFLPSALASGSTADAIYTHATPQILSLDNRLLSSALEDGMSNLILFVAAVLLLGIASTLAKFANTLSLFSVATQTRETQKPTVAATGEKTP